MRITKLGHACVRFEHDGTVVVVDPRVFTEPEAVDRADAPATRSPDPARRSTCSACRSPRRG